MYVSASKNLTCPELSYLTSCCVPGCDQTMLPPAAAKLHSTGRQHVAAHQVPRDDLGAAGGLSHRGCCCNVTDTPCSMPLFGSCSMLAQWMRPHASKGDTHEVPIVQECQARRLLVEVHPFDDDASKSVMLTALHFSSAGPHRGAAPFIAHFCILSLCYVTKLAGCANNPIVNVSILPLAWQHACCF